MIFRIRIASFLGNRPNASSHKSARATRKHQVEATKPHLAESVTPTLLHELITLNFLFRLLVEVYVVSNAPPPPPPPNQPTNSKVYSATDSTSQAKILPRSLGQCGQNGLLPPQGSSSRLEQKKNDKHPNSTKTPVDVQPKPLTPSTKPTHTQNR